MFRIRLKAFQFFRVAFMKKIIFLFLFTSSIFSKISADIIDNIEEVFVKVDGAEIFCKIMGQGDPIIVIHGGPGAVHDYLVPEISKLAKNNLVIFYDQRASGLSTGEITPDTMQIDVFIKDLECLQNWFGFKKVILLGHSWGAFLAIKYAIEHQELVDRLILLNTMPLSFQENILSIMDSRKKNPYLEEIRAIEKSEAYFLDDPVTLKRYIELRGKGHFYDQEKEHAICVPTSSKDYINQEKIGMAFMKNIKPFDLYEKLNDIKIPTLIIHGDADFIPIRLAEKIHKNILHSKYVLIEQCGHASMIEKSKEVLDAVNEFLFQEEDAILSSFSS